MRFKVNRGLGFRALASDLMGSGIRIWDGSDIAERLMFQTLLPTFWGLATDILSLNPDYQPGLLPHLDSKPKS